MAAPEEGAIREWDAEFRHGQEYLREAPTINVAVRHREVFHAIGGFDEGFGYGSDVDFTWRAVAEQLRVRYVPDAVVTHDWGSLGATSSDSSPTAARVSSSTASAAAIAGTCCTTIRSSSRAHCSCWAFRLALRRPLLPAAPAHPDRQEHADPTAAHPTAHDLAFGAGALAGAATTLTSVDAESGSPERCRQGD